jgi:long-chain acyl-CoA synthetase
MITDYFAKDLPPFDWPNFNYMLRDIRSTFAERVAFRYRSRGEKEFETWTYERLGREAEALSSFMLAHGLKRGDRVAIWSENRPEWGAAYMSILASGLVAVPIDALLSEEDVGRVLLAAEVHAVIASEKFAVHLESLLASVASAKVTIGLDGAPKARSGIASASWEEVSSFTGGPGLPEPETIATDADASIIFTSGTTGAPKGVVLSHSGIIANFDASIRSLPIDKYDVFMCVLPLHHTYPTTCSLVSPLAVGAAITMVEKLVGKVVVDDVRDTGGTVMIAVPLLYDKLAQAMIQGIRSKGLPVRAIVRVMRSISSLGCALGLQGIGKALLKGVRAQTGLGSLRLLVAGGGPLSASTAAVFDSFGFTIVQGYGMSENGPLIATNTPRYHDHHAAGLIVSRTQIRIDEPNEEGIGEIQVTSPSLMKGYWRNPEETARVITPDKWLRTGDLGRIDSRGFIYITGRIKSLIVTAGGKNIYPEEIEAMFEGSRVVREVLVVGKSVSGTPESRAFPAVAAKALGQAAAKALGVAEVRGAAAEEVAAVLVPDLESIAADFGKEKAANAQAVRELVKSEVERVNRELPPYKKMSDFYVRSSEFEKTSSRKIKRYLYKSWAAATGDE